MVLPVTGLVMILVFGFRQYPQEEIKGVRINRLENNAGKRVAICIGINNYEDNTFIKLEKAQNDAKELGKVLREFGQFDQVYVMTDDLDLRNEFYPRLSNIKRKMAFLKGLLDPQDLVVFSFSGHGISNAKGEGFLLTADSYSDDLYGSSLKVSDIIQWLKEADVRKSLLLLDACREKFQEKKSINLNGLTAERFTQAEVGAVFYSTRSGWYSYEDKQGNFGVFSRFVIEGLMGKADKTTGNHDGIVTFSELSSYVEEEVYGWALKESKKQRPYTQILGEKYGDLALSVYKKTSAGEYKPAILKTEEDENKSEGIKKKKIPNDKPADVRVIETKALRVYKNDKSYWEADYGEGIIMVYIPAGKFPMGSNGESDAEKPIHNVDLDGYWLSKTEVTVKQFRTFVNETKYLTEAETWDGAYTLIKGNWKKKKETNWKNPGFEQADNHPVVCVSWHDAVKYCEWLSWTRDIKFQLPTEAQWEKGARGTDGREFPWGNHKPYYNGKYFANYVPAISESNSSHFIYYYKYDEDGFYYTAPVGSYPQGASPYGLLDMAGNVFEWVNDWFEGDYYYKSAPSKNPTGPVSGRQRVIRGGSWFSHGTTIRSALRSMDNPSELVSFTGFRLAQGGR